MKLSNKLRQNADMFVTLQNSTVIPTVKSFLSVHERDGKLSTKLARCGQARKLLSLRSDSGGTPRFFGKFKPKRLLLYFQETRAELSPTMRINRVTAILDIYLTVPGESQIMHLLTRN